MTRSSAASGSGRRLVAGAMALVVMTALAARAPAQTPPSFQGCIAEALNQSAPLQPDGRYTISNVPADTGEFFRTLVTCPRAPGVVARGESALARIANGETLEVPALEFRTRLAVQGTLAVGASTTTLQRPGDRAQLTVVGTFPGGVQRNLTYPQTGTSYRSSNPSVARVGPSGEVIATARGVLVASALNAGRTASIRLEVRGAAGPDTDGDGMPDACELENGLDPQSPYDAELDPDLDGLTNRAECEVGTRVDDADTDDDGLDDAAEGGAGTDPTNADTDADELGDADELMRATDPLDPNTDGGCLLDGVEVRVGLDPLNPNDDAADSDNDGLTNCDEAAFGADPGNPDTDGDGIRDGEEVMTGTDGFITDPTDDDSDDDGLNDGAEVGLGTDPTDPATVASNVVVENRTVTLRGRVLLGSLTLRNNAVITLPAPTATSVPRLDLVVDSLSIDATSRIDATGRGFVGGLQSGNGTTSGRTLGNQSGSGRRSGGSYGGLGGFGDFDQVANPVYGDVRDPNEPGSGGGSDCGGGGNGGGLVRVTAGTITLNGQILANGQDGQGACGGGGSGGTVKLTAGTIAGAGAVRANGGPGDDQLDNGGGGGGGRVAIVYGTNAGFDFAQVEANGSVQGDGGGGVGTVFLRHTGSQALGEVIVDGRSVTPGRATPMYSLRGRASTALTATTLTDTAAAFVPGTLVGLELNPNDEQGETFTIVANDATTITVDAADGELTGIATAGDAYAASLALDRVTIAAHAQLELLDGDETQVDRRGRLTATDLVVTAEGRLSHPAATLVSRFGLDLTVPGVLTVAEDGAIDATGRGFVGGLNAGNGTSGRTLDNAGGSARRSGGSYGGLGGLGDFDRSTNPVYGDFRDPDHPGSGGGNDCGPGANGGGLVRITAGTVDVDGLIAADGGVNASSCAGGGSGGGVKIVTATLAGAGTIRANGGPGDVQQDNGGGGGGGRIAVVYATNAGFDPAHVQAIGGPGVGRGSPGTIFLRESDVQAHGVLRVDGGDLVPTRVTPLYSLQGGASTDLGATTLADAGAAFTPGSLIGLELNPNAGQTQTFTVVANDATTLFTDPADGDMTAVADAGDTYAGEPARLDAFTVAARALVEVVDGDTSRADRRGSLTTTDLSIATNGRLGHPTATSTQTFGLVLAVPGTLAIDATGRIDVTAAGFLGGLSGDNVSTSGRTIGNVAGSARRSGGTYAGLGGLGDFDRVANGQYGDPRDPDEPGSGGGNDCGPGANGGGLVRVVAGTVDVDGAIVADGAAATSACNGGGSGGGIRIDTGTLRGDGEIRANGGQGDQQLDNGGGGGGGRVAVYYDALDGFDPARLIAVGGNGAGPGGPAASNVGGAGTVYRQATGARGVLVVRDTRPNMQALGRETPLPQPYDGDDILLDASLTSATDIDPFALTLVNAAVLRHPGATISTVPRLEIDATTVAIDATSRIDLTGRGFLGGLSGDNGSTSGRTAGNALGSGRRSGGTYAGLGGLGDFDRIANGQYGDFQDPNELGSGGGNDCGPGANGGGLLRLTTDTLDLDGEIVADGAGSTSFCNGGGSGGGVKIVAGTVSGGGSVRANGGLGDQQLDNGGGGGGGRIALHYDTLSGFDLANLDVQGGNGLDRGGTGTIYTKQTGAAGQLIVRSSGRETPLPALIGGIDVTLDAARVSATAIDAPIVRLTNGSILTHPPATTDTESRLEMDVTTLEIDATSRIDVSGRGYRGGQQDGTGSIGRTLDNADGSGRRVGGSYGGLGGIGNFDPIANPVYGDFRDPNEPGSGGGSDCAPGASGGGLVRITAGTVTVNGQIAADGQGSTSFCNGGGSGGGIKVVTTTLGGTGTIHANGGAGDQQLDDGGGGGGGRVALHHATLAGFDLANASAVGGIGLRRGGVGTVFVRDTDVQPHGELVLDGKGADPTRVTPLYSLQGAPSTALAANSLTDTAAAFVPGTLMGLELNPNDGQQQTFTVIANDATTLFTDPADGSMTAVASVGDTYFGVPTLDRLVVTAKAQLEALDGDAAQLDRRGHLRASDAEVTADGLLTHPVATTGARFGLDVEVTGTLVVDAASAIDVSGKGFLGGLVGGNGTAGRTLGNVDGSGRRVGGSYGGLGGVGTFDPTPNPVYGDFRDPDEPGSGGGNDCGTGANGGGLLRLTVGTLDLAGQLLANGQGSTSACNGGGSGGGIRVLAGLLTGTGSIAANGGAGDQQLDDGGGGGGGRVAVLYDQLGTFTLANVQAAGGIGRSGANGGAGTIWSGGYLIADNVGRTVSDGSTPLRAIGAGTSTALGATSLEDGAATFPSPDPVTGAVGLVGLELRPNTGAAQTFTVLGNDATTLFTEAADGAMTSVATTGNPYVGVYLLDGLIVRNGARVATADRIESPDVDVDPTSRLQSSNLNLP